MAESSPDQGRPLTSQVLVRVGPRMRVVTLLVAVWVLLPPQASESKAVLPSQAVAGNCDDTKIAEVLQPASEDHPDVVVNCSLTLPSNRVVTKRLIVRGREGSGATIDCAGATIDGSAIPIPKLAKENAEKRSMILIKSTGSGDLSSATWGRPTDVTVKNCKVIGAVRVRAVEYGKTATDVRVSSYRPGHVGRLRAIAPTRITFDHLTVTAVARTPVFFGAGVTDSMLINSELKGRADGVAIYLEAESSRNLIKSNYIHTVSPREVLAIDASNHNRIIDNRLSALNHGGIYLYRNCGEVGIVRHTTPSYNVIVNNVFYYKKYNPTVYSVRPSVYMGSRNGNKNYCGQEDDQTLGSGASNLDYAGHNVVMQNQLYKLSVALMIRQGRGTDSPNFVRYNTTVSTPVPRLAGCYVATGYFRHFIVDGESIEQFRRADGSRYTGPRYRCEDGQLLLASPPAHG